MAASSRNRNRQDDEKAAGTIAEAVATTTGTAAETMTGAVTDTVIDTATVQQLYSNQKSASGVWGST